ncbi:MAG TPA: DUF6057 family protein [Sedimentisphaerales bacterium]|nr:DUF6057 family protein [Sedimentisphaerales bacterium]
MRARNVTQKLDTWRRLTLPRELVFFVFFYLYFALEIDVRLLYHCGGLIDNFPAFYRGWDFFRGFLTYPGGIVEYLSDLLVQSFYYSWLGAIVVTGQAWAICLCTDYAIRSFGIPRWRGLRFLGPLLLLAIYSQYTFHFPTTMGLLVALISFCLYLRFTPNGITGTILLFLILSTVLYIAAGGPVLLFVVLCGLYEVLLRDQKILGLAQLASGAAMPYFLGIIAYGARFHDAYFQLLPFSWRLLSRQSGRTMLSAVYVLYLFLPLVTMVQGGWRLFLRKRDRLVSSKARSGNPAMRSRGRGGIRGAVNNVLRDRSGDVFSLSFQTLALAGITVVILLLYRDPELRKTLWVDYFSRHRMWTEVIEIGRRNPYHYLVCHAVNRALYQTGRLGDEMFCFPQHPTSLFLTRKGMKTEWQKFDTCMDLGLVNQAENALSISVEIFGERPLLLQRLAVVNMVKGNVGAARVFVRALEKVPFWSSVARGYMARLESDPDLSEDSEIQPLRKVMLHTDYVGEADTLTFLLTENPKNRMAYMYGMAWLLLSKNLDGFVQKFNTYHHRNFSTIPRHFQEALLLSRFLKKQPTDVPGQVIDEQTKTQFSEFSRAMQQHGKSVNTARAALKERFGNTYFYYYFLGG